MAVPASGQLCMQGLAREKVYDDYSASPGLIIAPISLYDLVHGGNACGSGNSYDATNTASPSYPPVVNTNLCFSAWYSYDHDYPTGPSWSTGGNMLTCRTWGSGTGASSNTGLMTQGSCYDGPSGALPSNANCQTYEYNGSSWSTGGNHTVVGRDGSATGTQNDALSHTFRAAPPFNLVYGKSVVLYDGASWSASVLCSPGAIACRCSGKTFPGTSTTNDSLHPNGDGAGCCVYRVFDFGGTFVTGVAGATIASCRQYQAAAGGGSNASSITGGYGGNGSSAMCSTEEYGGTSWSSGGNLITQRVCLGGSNQGSQNDFCVWGGKESSICSCTEIYNGTSWSSGPAMITGVRNAQNGGGTSSAFVTGGTCIASAGYGILTTQELA